MDLLSKRFFLPTLFLLTVFAQAQTPTPVSFKTYRESGEGPRVENDQYEVWFDHRDYFKLDYGPYFQKIPIHVRDKKTGLTREILFSPDFGVYYSVSRLLLNGRYLSIYNHRGSSDHESRFFSRFDLEKGEDLGDLQSGEIESLLASFSPDGKHFVYFRFTGNTHEYGFKLAENMEVITMDAKGWNHISLNVIDCPNDLEIKTGKRLPGPSGRKSPGRYVVSNFLWSLDSRKVFYIAADRKSSGENDSAEFGYDDTPSGFVYYGLVSMDLANGLESINFRSHPFDEDAFQLPEDREFEGLQGAEFTVELKWDKGKILAKLRGTHKVDGKYIDWETAWREEKTP